jgi:hypothetical protein
MFDYIFHGIVSRPGEIPKAVENFWQPTIAAKMVEIPSFEPV